MPESYIPTYSTKFVRTVTMCIHISPVCNLNCKYCFKKQSEGDLTIADVQRFIDCVLQVYPHADRYIVDMSGAGEPLLRKDLLFKIARYCKTLSDKHLREFLPTIVTNGTLLTEQVVNELQSEGVLFGVSLDGTRDAHNKNRVFQNGDGSYDIIEKNIRGIKHKDFVGAALTYSGADLLQSFLSAFKLLPTVSMKPVRYTDGNELDADAICASYDELVEFVLNKLLNADTSYTYALLNGDDYFGKFLRRVTLNVNVLGRCDAGIGRFALAGDKKIYCCPAAAHIDGGIVGDLENGINQSKIRLMWSKLYNTMCGGCEASGACGGECKIVSYNRYGNFDGIDSIMCKIKRHIYGLAKRFVAVLADTRPDMLEWLKETCSKVESYYDKDDALINAVKLSQGQYKYSEMKKIKDTKPELFRELYAKLINS
ncbi:MAG: radical SAM protein [Clostridiales bacterium]|nr:radical SAM protein [Clostridiales bacterium]